MRALLVAQALALGGASEYSCGDNVKDVNDYKWKVMGTSLGGQYVLEPWLTPSLFYQFLGADAKYGPDINKIKEKTGMDHMSFCRALGPKEGNKQLRRHWPLWVTEEGIAALAKTGTTTLRIPVGDFMFKPYGVYAEVEDGVRCNDGAIEDLDRVLDLIHKYGMNVLIDMHAWMGSQNGLDNSGESLHVKWAVEYQDHTYAPVGTFEHWKYKGWNWLVPDTVPWATAMQNINKVHWDHTISTLKLVMARYGNHPAIWGLSPVNEVGMWTPMDVLRKYYWEAYWIVRNKNPNWMFIMDASFRGGEVAVGGFMSDCVNKAVDKHPYHAWAGWGKMDTYFKRSCGWAAENELVETTYNWPVISGEWSLASTRAPCGCSASTICSQESRAPSATWCPAPRATRATISRAAPSLRRRGCRAPSARESRRPCSASARAA
jgi:glucan 1,3-beta-glucosidase